MTTAHDTFSCPRCGERLPAGFTRCDSCGAYLVPALGGAGEPSHAAPAIARGGGGQGGHGGRGRQGGARLGGSSAARHAPTGGIPTTAWVFLLLGLACGGAIGYALHGAVGPRSDGGMPTGPSDLMAGMAPGGGAAGGGPAGGAAPMAGGAMPAEVMAQVQQYKAALARDPDDLQANIGFGNLLFDSSQWQKAVDHYALALAKDPGNADVRVDMGIALHELGQNQRAVDEMSRVTRERPDHKNAWLNLGVVSSQMGDRATAIRAWDRYLALDPNGPHAAAIREQVQQLKRGA